MIRLAVTAFAILMFVVGAILAPTPIPVGLVMMAVATFILIANNKWAEDLVRAMRRRWRRVDGWMRVLEDKTGGHISATLKKTRPEPDDHPAPGPEAG